MFVPVVKEKQPEAWPFRCRRIVTVDSLSLNDKCVPAAVHDSILLLANLTGSDDGSGLRGCINHGAGERNSKPAFGADLPIAFALSAG